MDSQTLYDNALFGIRKQGKASVLADKGKCLYRGPDNCKCAAGHNITDEEYMPQMDEGNGTAITVSFIGKYHLNRLAGFESFLRELQLAHDEASFYENDFLTIFEGNMKRLAQRYNLRYSPPR